MENARSPREGARASATGMADKVWADIENIKNKGEFIPPSPQDVEQGPPANRTTARGPKRNLEMKLRIIKSNSEVAKINRICKITSDAYENLPLLIKEGDSERDISRKLRIDLISRGADSISFLPIVSGGPYYASNAKTRTISTIQGNQTMNCVAPYQGSVHSYASQNWVTFDASNESSGNTFAIWVSASDQPGSTWYDNAGQSVYIKEAVMCYGTVTGMQYDHTYSNS